MKNIIKLTILAFVVLSSCKKDKTSAPVNNGEEKAVTFSINNFGIEHGDIKINSLRDAVVNQTNSNIKEIRIGIYNKQGILYQNISRTDTGNGFGNIALKIPVGEYTVIFAGSVHLPDEVFPVKMTSPLSTANIDYAYSRQLEDFYKKITLNVVNEDITQPITLDRVVAQLQVTIKDAIPPGTDHIALTVDTTYDKLQLIDGKPVTSSIRTGITYYYNVENAIGQSNFVMSRYLYPMNNNPIGISIKSYDRKNVLISSKAIRTATIARNKITQLAGNLFGGNGSGNNGTSVVVDSGWSSDVIEKQF